jgi:hypothetical protein
MKRNLVAVAVIVTFAETAGAQAITVVGTGDPSLDIPAVQSAVDQGGRVILKGHFSFDAPPTVPEQPAVAFSGDAFGMVLISRAVAVSGMTDDQGELTTIEGGTNPFYVEAPGAHITIQGLHFVHSKVFAIRVASAGGLAIASNKFDGVVPDTRAIGPASAIVISTFPGDAPTSGQGQPENISGTLWVANNDIDMQGMAGSGPGFFGIAVEAVGSPDQEVDLYIFGNNIRNSTVRPLNIYSIGGRAYIERNVITTDGIGKNFAPSGDVMHIVGPGSFLIAHNTIDCGWTSGQQSGIRLQTRQGEPVSHAVVVDNDVNMSAPAGTMFTATSAAIEVRGAGDGNIVANNRIRGRASFALSVANQNGAPHGTAFIMNDLSGFTSTQADLFVDSGGANTIAVGAVNTVEDHGAGTDVVPVR